MLVFFWRNNKIKQLTRCPASLDKVTIISHDSSITYSSKDIATMQEIIDNIFMYGDFKRFLGVFFHIRSNTTSSVLDSMRQASERTILNN